MPWGKEIINIVFYQVLSTSYIIDWRAISIKWRFAKSFACYYKKPT